jgi:translation initiation factor 1
MARKEPDPPHELDPLKGGLKHNPLAALRAKLDPRALPPGPVERATSASAVPNSGSAKSVSTSGGTPRSHASTTRGDAKSAPAPLGITVRIERTGRGGKIVTIAEGPGLHGRKLEPLAREIARGMGTGARVESSAIVVQGDQRERLVVWLAAHGFGGAVAGN